MSTVRSEWYDSGSFANDVKNPITARQARTGIRPGPVVVESGAAGAAGAALGGIGAGAGTKREGGGCQADPTGWVRTERVRRPGRRWSWRRGWSSHRPSTATRSDPWDQGANRRP